MKKKLYIAALLIGVITIVPALILAYVVVFNLDNVTNDRLAVAVFLAVFGIAATAILLAIASETRS